MTARASSGGKEDLLAALLESTAPSYALARELIADERRPAAARLWELCRSDVELLCAGPHNLGALYLLPAVRGERFAGFHRLPGDLNDSYARVLGATTAR